MKIIKFFIITFVIFSLITISFGGSVIKEFRIDPGFNKVHLVWKVSVESNIKGYKIQRGFSQTQLSDLDFLNAKPGDISPGTTKDYEYTDKSIFKNENRTFYYRIVVLDNQQKPVTSSEVKQVSPQISAVRHTWGSIKAMFR